MLSNLSSEQKDYIKRKSEKLKKDEKSEKSYNTIKKTNHTHDQDFVTNIVFWILDSGVSSHMMS
jgi:hypothetical protein